MFLLFQKVLDPSFPQPEIYSSWNELFCHPGVTKYFTTPL